MITRQSLQTTKVRYICTDIRSRQSMSISATGSYMNTHQKAVAHQVEHDGRGAAERLVPHRGVVREVLPRAARIVRVHDPHLLAEHGLHGDVDGDHGEEARAERQEEAVAALAPRPAAAVLQDEPHAREVQHELNACGCMGVRGSAPIARESG